ncbi:MAG: phosphonate C-P lyase system protein PhnG [Pseudomonadota bacterium]
MSNPKETSAEKSDATTGSPDRRRQVMAILARASGKELSEAWSQWPDRPHVSPLRGPETGLVMLRGRIGGGGAPFNFGEATVTRATVKLSTGQVGHAYALGTDSSRVRHAAIFDALWQNDACRATVEERLIAPVKDRLAAEDQKRRDETAATKVDFFTMVRGED